MWRNSTTVDVYANLSIPEDSGWTKGDDGSYNIDLDSSELQTEVHATDNQLSYKGLHL